MARFDLYRDRSGNASYLLDVQTDFLTVLGTRLVIPLLPQAQFSAAPIARLHLPVTVAGEALVLVTNFMAAVSVKQCGEVCGSLKDRSHEVTAAIDFLLQGF